MVKKTLKESIGETEFEALKAREMNFKACQVIKKLLKAEAKLDTADITATSNIYDQIILGCDPFLTRDLCRVVEVVEETTIFEVNARAVAGPLAGGVYPTTGADTTEVPITADRDYGVNAIWTRQYLERAANFAVMSWQTIECGKAIETELMDFIIATYIADNGQHVDGEHDWLDWDDVILGFTAALNADSKPDVCLCSPSDYANLFNDQEFVSSLYTTDNDPMRTGKVKSTLGMEFIRSSRMPDHLALLIEKNKAGALCIRRDITVEPYERPEEDEYGFVVSHRYGFDSLNACAITLISDT